MDPPLTTHIDQLLPCGFFSKEQMLHRIFEANLAIFL